MIAASDYQVEGLQGTTETAAPSSSQKLGGRLVPKMFGISSVHHRTFCAE